MYWIQGKPGSGKSTLMKFAMRDPRMTKLLASDGMEQWSLAAFFFHDRGSEKQKTLVGMLQEILRSILQQIPALSRYVIPAYLELVRSQRTRCPSWDFSSLKSALVSLIEQRHVKMRVLLLLDALDEHQGDNDILASLLKILADKSDNERVKLKMCLASRSWTVFQQHFGNCPGFSIHDHTREDIMRYIKARMGPCGPQEMHQSDHDNIMPLANLVATRASGVFIWVRLVVDLLAKGIQDGTPYRTLKEKVNKIPQELRDLYADTLRRIEPEYSSEAFIMLQTTLCSFEPLPLEVLMYISDVNSDSARLDPAWYGDLPEESTSSQKSRLASRSGGLLEAVQRDQSESESDDLVVQFIHQTVKEYVQSAPKNLGLAQASSKILQANGYDLLLRTCSYCYNEWVTCIKKDVFDYARCATRKCKEDHGAHESECSRLISGIIDAVDTSMYSRLAGGPIDLLWFLGNQKGYFFADLLSDIKAESMIEEEPRKMQIARLAVAMNFPEYFVLRPGISHGNGGHGGVLYQGLLHLAVAVPWLNPGIRDADHEYMIRVLVGAGCGINELNPGMLKYIDGDQRLTMSNEGLPISPLGQILVDRAGPENVRLSIVKTLLDLGASADFKMHLRRVGFNGWQLCSLLEYCVLFESAAFVRLLLQHGAKATTSFFADRFEFLRFARIRQDTAVIQTLLDFGLGEVGGEDTSDDLASVKEALRIQSHVLAAPSGGLSTALFSRESDIERVRQATANSSRGVANNSSPTTVE